jgi:murein DD-endopeptidase MepM/ murein hydrolase activator NlpD
MLYAVAVTLLLATAGAASAAPQNTSLEADLDRLRDRALLVPVAGVPASALVDTYLQRRDAGMRTHEALDIPAPIGTPVIAVENGRLAKLFTSRQGGLTIYQFDPAGEFAYYYAHLDRYAPDLTQGAVVRRGDVIGYVGSTGNASTASPHLHFGVYRLGPERAWWRGTPLNPYLLWSPSRR